MPKKLTVRPKWGGGKRITEFYEGMGIKRPKFVATIGYGYDAVLAYELDRTIPGPDFFRSIKRHYPEADLTWLLTGASEPPKIKEPVLVPILNRIHAGPMVIPLDDEKILGWLRLDREQQGNRFALEVQGDSMYPEIQNGDIALCDPDLSFLNGKIYAVSTVEFESTLKRVFKRKDGYELVPSNPDYPTAFVPESQMHAMARVIELIRKMG